MKWIEIIELRSAPGRDFLNDIDLQALVTNLPEGCKPYRLVFFRHGTVKSDVGILLMFNTSAVQWQGSEPGLWLKEMLQASGLVSHKIWIETASFQMLTGNDDS